jgi:hypothetical protein
VGNFRDELRHGAWLVEPEWRKPVARQSAPTEVVPWECTDAEASAAILDYITKHPGAFATDIADALNIPIIRTFDLVDRLVAEGSVEEG